MVANTLNTFCALTVQCARCHDHKFDPVKQEDYYRLQAVFAALDRTDRSFDIDPAVANRRAKLASQKRALEERKNQLEGAITTAGGQRLFLLGKLLDEMRRGNETVERPEFGWHSAIEKSQDETKWVQVDLKRSVPISAIVYAACNDDFAGIGAGFGFPLRFKVELSDDGSFARDVTLLEDNTGADTANPGVKPRRINGDGRKARYVRVTATKLAPRRNDFIFALAEIQVFDQSGHNVALGTTVTSLDSIEAPAALGAAEPGGWILLRPQSSGIRRTYRSAATGTRIRYCRNNDGRLEDRPSEPCNRTLPRSSLAIGRKHHRRH
jgi:hypothetical protein